MNTRHNYAVHLVWTGNTGSGTSSLRSYSRDHQVDAKGLAQIAASADPAFLGDPTRWNPEQLYLTSIAQCHMLWYLGLAARSAITVVAYDDHPTGIMVEESSGAGEFESVTLHPTVTIDSRSDPRRAKTLHEEVADYCFIARSVKTPILHEANIIQLDSDAAS
ncbi:OsmC family protein [Rhodococcus sp. BP22]|uniref:OsmC family protein n=1 Tax=Rhodococcus sp. BP22 TaxID=2758566 RepID=UPI001648178E|nr:OsmC family protein [Rhodococcus sp. BP22]